MLKTEVMAAEIQHMYSVMSDICCFILFRGWICASVSPSVASLRRPITSQIKDA